VEEIRADTGARVLGLKVDVCQETDIERMVADTQAAFGRLDILVSNAGMAVHKRTSRPR
jgi:NAD(P)-dependent dehydrogenase (short-subunit alcohol dehydrogenase family)